MRRLNARQKRLLDKQWAMGKRSVYTLSASAFMELVKMNDHETLYQNADRYLMDKTLEEVHVIQRGL